MILKPPGRYFAFIVLIGLLTAGGLVLFPKKGAAAQKTAEKTIRLNLKQLIERAVAVSPEAGEAKSDLIAAKSSLEQAKAAYYPQLESTAVVGPVKNAEEPIIVNHRIYDPSPGLSLSSIGIFGRLDFTVIQPLYTFGKLSNEKEAARCGIAAKQLEIDKTADSIALRVSQLYYALILARSGISAAQDAENFFSDARDRIQRLLKAGSANVSESDLYMVDAFRAGAVRSQAEAGKGIKVATFALRSMLEIPPGIPFEVVPEPLEIKEKEIRDLNKFVQDALSNRPEFKQLQEALKASRYQAAAAVSELYPSFFLALEASLAGAPGRDHFDNPYIDDDFNHAHAGVVAGAKWEFDFGIKKARIEEARAEYQKLLYTRKKAEMNIPVQVTNAYQDIIEWKKSAKIYHDAAVSSRKWVVSAFADFDMGIGTAENLLRAIEKYGDNQGSYIEALYNYHLGVANLKYATGMIRQSPDGK